MARLLNWRLGGAWTHAKTSHWCRSFALLLVLAISDAAHGQEMVPGYSDDFYYLDAREVRLLPPYCVYTQYFDARYRTNEAEKKRWVAALGPTFIHLHHYCFALLKTNRALLLTKEKRYREFYLRDSLREFEYIIDRSPSDFVLLPEIHTKKGENLVRLGRGQFAVFEFERAIELNPEYWPPYAQLADHYKTTGATDKARDVLAKGLSRAPEAKALQRRLAELDQAVVRPQ